MTEKTLDEALQAVLQGLSIFDNDDVTINDHSILDGSSAAAPFAIIATAVNHTRRNIQTGARAVTTEIPFTLFVRFTDWDDSSNELRDDRETIFDALEDVLAMAAINGGLAWAISELRTNGPIAGVYDRYEENGAESFPIYLSQELVVVCNEIRLS